VRNQVSHFTRTEYRVGCIRSQATGVRDLYHESGITGCGERLAALSCRYPPIRSDSTGDVAGRCDCGIARLHRQVGTTRAVN
jgi:hypothetical protein